MLLLFLFFLSSPVLPIPETLCRQMCPYPIYLRLCVLVCLLVASVCYYIQLNTHSASIIAHMFDLCLCVWYFYDGIYVCICVQHFYHFTCTAASNRFDCHCFRYNIFVSSLRLCHFAGILCLAHFCIITPLVFLDINEAGLVLPILQFVTFQIYSPQMGMHPKTLGQH